MGRLDRYSDEVDAEEPDDLEQPPAHADDCTGWLEDDELGRPTPCLVCKPHLARRNHR